MLRTTLLALAIGASLPVLAFAQDARESRAFSRTPVIQVSGQAVVRAEPDMATFNVGVEIKDPSASKAMSQAAKISDQLIAALKSQNVPKEKIQTIQLSLDQVWEPIPQPEPNAARPNQNRMVYQATHILRVEVGKDRFNDLGDILDAAMKAGANNVGGVSFGIKDDTGMRNEGLAQAIKNARSKAALMADAAGVHLQRLQMLSEGEPPAPPRPMMMMAKEAFAAAAPSPVPPSEIERTYSVTAVYEISS
jgi:uncharacterized protein YggE